MGDQVAGDKIVIHGQVGAAGRHATAEGNTFGQGGGSGRPPDSGKHLRRVVWVLLSALILFLFLGPEELPPYKHGLLSFFAAITAGAFGYSVKGQKPIPRGVRTTTSASLFLLVLAWSYSPLAPIQPFAEPSDSIYRLRVTMLDPQGRPMADGELFTSVGGELQRFDGGWEIEIPAAKRPEDGLIEIRAREGASFLEGSTEYDLVEGQFQQAVTLRLEAPTDAQISGRVLDADGQPVVGATVRGDRGPDIVLTDASGYFSLPANAADGQTVGLHAEKEGVGSVEQGHPAGPHPVELVLR